MPHPSYAEAQAQLRAEPKTWLVTGVAGFIGSNLLEALLGLGQRVVGLDNFATGFQDNLDQVRQAVTPDCWSGFRMMEADICDLAACQKACQGVDYVLHQAALGSVPASIESPLATHASNVTGFLNMILASRDSGVKRFVYASTCALYGDDPRLPKQEDQLGAFLSPYAAGKHFNEQYAAVFARCYQFFSIGLRYFNVFGPRQDPGGAYAAVIPKWIAAMLAKEPISINGDGETSRDFCYVANVVQANILAARASDPGALNQVYNIAAGGRTSLNALFEMLRARLAPRFPHLRDCRPTYRDFRAGDVRHSQADIAKARSLLGFLPSHDIQRGLDEALEWYIAHL